MVYQTIGTHECLVQIVAQEQCVRCPDVLSDRVKHIQSRQLVIWGRLHISQPTESSYTSKVIMIVRPLSSFPETNLPQAG